MATLTIRNLPDEVRDRLRLAAAERGRSMEAEVRAALTERFGSASKPDFDADAVTQEVQAAFAPYRAQRGSAVDALIAERRVAADRQWAELDLGVDVVLIRGSRTG